MDGIFFGLGLLAAVAGLFVGGTTGVSFIGIACFLGISARLIQALKQHKHLIEVLTQKQVEEKAAGKDFGGIAAPLHSWQDNR